MKKQQYVVYFVYHKDVIVYIGEGLPNRPAHATSGCSSVYGLNELHFTDRENVRTEVKFVVDSKQEAVVLEKQYIEAHQPRYNTKGIGKDARIEKMQNRLHLLSCIDTATPRSTKGYLKRDRAGFDAFCKRYTADELFAGVKITRGASQNPYRQMSVEVENRAAIQCFLRNVIVSGVREFPLELFFVDGSRYLRLNSVVREAYQKLYDVTEVKPHTMFRHFLPLDPKGAYLDSDVQYAKIIHRG